MFIRCQVDNILSTSFFLIILLYCLPYYIYHIPYIWHNRMQTIKIIKIYDYSEDGSVGVIRKSQSQLLPAPSCRPNRVGRSADSCLPSASCCFLAWLTLWPWNLRWYVPFTFHQTMWSYIQEHKTHDITSHFYMYENRRNSFKFNHVKPLSHTSSFKLENSVLFTSVSNSIVTAIKYKGKERLMDVVHIYFSTCLRSYHQSSLKSRFNCDITFRVILRDY